MVNYKLHNDYKTISAAEYRNSKIKAPADWKCIKTKSNILTGFRAGVYKKDNNLIIVYRGTDTPIDIVNIWHQYGSKMYTSTNKRGSQIL